LAAGLTQRQVADHVGVETMAVSRWEREVQRPKDTHVALIAEATNRPVPWFYTEQEPDPIAA
jgi:transcriptional regulator with XRE-family HTH domain